MTDQESCTLSVASSVHTYMEACMTHSFPGIHIPHSKDKDEIMRMVRYDKEIFDGSCPNVKKCFGSTEEYNNVRDGMKKMQKNCTER